MTTTWWNSGSVKRGDYATGLEALHVDLTIDSDGPRDELENLIAMSERACYVLSALDRPPQPTLSVEVNGEPF